MKVALHSTGCHCGERNNVLLARVPELRAARRQRVQVPGRGHAAPARAPDAARVDRLRLLPRQRRGRPARVVVPPRRLRDLVRGRAGHADERGSAHRGPAPERRAHSRARGGSRPRHARGLMRLPAQPDERIDRGRTVRFTYDGRPVSGFAGDTLGSALFASGRRVFSRSFKYHRPRGLLCCSGQCPNCMMTVDGVPNVRACVEPLREGAVVTPQNVLGKLDFDLLNLVDKLGGPFTPVGFYYRTMIRPRKAWPLYEKFLRNAAGLGKLDEEAGHSRRYDVEHRKARVLVIGGGGSGRAAALAAAREGPGVVLVDEHAVEDELPGVDVIAPGTALGIWEGGLVPVACGTVLYRFRAERIVVATGTLEQPLVYPGNDLVGTMFPSAVTRLIHEFALKPGERAVVIGADDRALATVDDLRDAGVEVARVLDLRETRPRELAAHGKAGRVRGLLVDREAIDCDLVVASGARQ